MILLINLTIRYFFWHYTKAFADFFRIWLDFFWFCLHFFSLPTMFRTLISPWKRMGEGSTGGLKAFLSSLIVNTIMRIVGFIMRIGLITAGFLSLFLVLGLGIFAFIAWVFIPIIIPVVFVKGILIYGI